MALDFPASPSNGATHIAAGAVWMYDGTKWKANSAAAPGDITSVTAGTGLSGGGSTGDVSLALATPVSVANGGTGSTTAAAAPWVESGGDVMTGILTLSGPPVGNSDAATKAYVDAVLPAAAQAPAVQNNVGRNLLHNPLFNIAQRGVGPFSGGAYTLDRWYGSAANGDACAFAQSAANDTNRAQIGDEAAIYYLANSFTGTAAAGALSIIYQPIEGVRRLAGKTVVVSFWAQSNGTLKLGVSFDQAFGSGGSPSANVVMNGQSITTSTTWTRYSLTFALPSTAGKTLGTSNNSSTNMFFWYSSGSTNNVRSGSVGVQSGVINIWGVQLEIGSTMTPLEKPDPQQDLAKCQRFYQQPLEINARCYGNGAGSTFVVPVPITPMRAIPTIGVLSGGTSGNITGGTGLNAENAAMLRYVMVSAAAGDTAVADVLYSLSADL